MEQDKIILFEDKKDCCGCGACMNICPKQAITMVEDARGFVYPQIDYDKCIKCGACKRVCGYQQLPKLNNPKDNYASATKNDKQLKKSASGGIFAAVAENILKNGGIVYGAAMQYEGKLIPKHIRIDSVKDLIKLQGSKYVQSSIGDCYKNAKADLTDGKQVLFSGTPCQIAGLQKFLGKEYDNLLTIDIICHGVPNAKMFQDFIATKEKKFNGKIEKFLFRDKSKGQGMTSLFAIRRGNKVENKIINGKVLSFFTLFLKSYTYRENCYSCPFAQKQRVSDMTLGDFWGFHEEYPNLDKKWNLSNEKGVSCIIVNTEKGQKCIEQNKDSLILMKSDFDKIAKHNDQLHTPSKSNPKREIIMNLYQEKGYDAVEEYYIKNFRIDRLKQNIRGMIPKNLRRNVQKIMGSLRK